MRDICIGGVCREIPCDLNMESDAVEDGCGVCRGDSTSCTLKQGTVSFAAEDSKEKCGVTTNNDNRFAEIFPGKILLLLV